MRDMFSIAQFGPRNKRLSFWGHTKKEKPKGQKLGFGQQSVVYKATGGTIRRPHPKCSRRASSKPILVPGTHGMATSVLNWRGVEHEKLRDLRVLLHEEASIETGGRICSPTRSSSREVRIRVPSMAPVARLQDLDPQHGCPRLGPL